MKVRETNEGNLYVDLEGAKPYVHEGLGIVVLFNDPIVHILVDGQSRSYRWPTYQPGDGTEATE